VEGGSRRGLEKARRGAQYRGARIGRFQRGKLGKSGIHEVLVVQNIFHFAFKERMSGPVNWARLSAHYRRRNGPTWLIRIGLMTDVT
jgi:hypothetical protein